MDQGIYGALKDPQFWTDIKDRLAQPAHQVMNTLTAYGKIPEQADALAEQYFPGSARDSSMKNAFRHSLGTGMLAQKIGGGYLGASLAKLAGYGWEGMGILDGSNLRSPAHTEDMRHDLNANAIGADQAMKTRNQDELVQALRRLATDSVVEPAPAVWQRSPGYLTRSVK